MFSFKVCLSACLLLVCWLQCAFGQQQLDPNQYCLSCSQRRNHKDLYRDTVDCHRYVQCFYLNETFAVGISRQCPVGTFWHDSVLSCMPEGPTPCNDVCNDPNASSVGCYGVPNNCASFFVCANTASYPFCCPPKTSFNSTTCQCDDSETCTDKCSLPVARGTTVKPPTVINSRLCRDSYDNLLSIVDGHADQFVSIGEESNTTQNCAPGSFFVLEACRCEGTFDDAEPRARSRQCRFYLPFDDDLRDYSTSKFETFIYGDYELNRTGLNRGYGSLYLKNAHMEVPGLKSIDFRGAASWCMYFKPDDWNKNFSQGLLSNNNGTLGTEMSIVIASLAKSAVQVTLKTAKSKNVVSLTGTADLSIATSYKFVQVCVVYGANKTAKLYLNNRLFQTVKVSDDLGISHCPYVIGHDQTYGGFTGFIDEVLVCDFPLTAEDVNAHWGGQIAMINAGLVPNTLQPTTTPYTNIQPQPPSNDHQCGHSKVWNSGEIMLDSLGIVGGVDALENEFPWQVLFFKQTTPTAGSVCGAVVLSDEWVITAAHCCVYTVTPVRMLMFFGGNSGWQGINKTSSLFKVVREISPSQLFVHPEYNASNHWKNDFCMVRVKPSIPLNTWAIQPICLPSSCDETCHVGEPIVISGFGTTGEMGGLLAKKLQKAINYVVADDHCEANMGFYAGYLRERNTICCGVTGFGGISICQGDSGGPLACYKNGYFVLQGVTSYGRGCAEPRFPMEFAAVCYQLDWINKYLYS